ncbi:MAG: bifunctional oligoribonuclease/PAP phosphatase NrnA [Clostridia bacterium]
MTKAMNETNEMNALLSAVQTAGSILLFSHISPDGDTLGSALALKIRLERLGKRVAWALDGEVPENLSFLPTVQCVQKPIALSETACEYDLAISVDVSCEERMGECLPLFLAAKQQAVIDHHGTNPGFGKYLLIDAEAPATAVLIHRLFERMSMPLQREEAVCLYTALATDTGNFIYESTNSESFHMMGNLMDTGFALSEYSRLLFRQKRLEFVKLLGKVLSTLRVTCDGAVAGLTLTMEDLKQAGASHGDTDCIVDYAIDIEGVKLAYFAKETEDGRVKVSLRALAPYRIDEVASRVGGGGHRLAAGCTVDVPLAEAALAMEAALKTELDRGKAV